VTTFFYSQFLIDAQESEYVLLTINEIMNGSSEFRGIIPLINIYLASSHIDATIRQGLNTYPLLHNNKYFLLLFPYSCLTKYRYLSFISKRASGELCTAAGWIRNFVATHPSYKHDSVVNEEISFDLVKACRDISDGVRKEPTLLGNFV
jgi:glutamate--cysteine ligase catalytic subunit